MDPKTMKWVGLGGCAAMAVGVLLPWASFSGMGMSISVNGFHGAGILIFLSGLAGALFAYGEIKLAIAPAGVGAGLTAIQFLQMGDVSSMGGSIGIGFWLTVAGAVAGVIGTLPLLKTGKEISALGEMFGGKK